MSDGKPFEWLSRDQPVEWVLKLRVWGLWHGGKDGSWIRDTSNQFFHGYVRGFVVMMLRELRCEDARVLEMDAETGEPIWDDEE